MSNLDWKWLWWQVGLPLFAPILLSIVFALFWWSLSPGFMPKVEVLVDLTPWALATYALTLIGTTLGSFWNRMAQHRALGTSLLAVAGVDTIYYAFMVIRRHDPAFAATSEYPAYFVTAMLVAAAIVLCYRAR